MSDQRHSTLPPPVRGFRSRPINGILAYLGEDEVRRTRGGRAGQPLATRLFRRPFDLARIAGTGTPGSYTVAIYDHGGREHAVGYKGLQKTVADGAGMTWDSDLGWWLSDAISAAAFIYLRFDRINMEVSIVCASAQPDGDDDNEYWPLWYLPWTTVDSVGMVQESSIEDLRYGFRITGMGL